MKRALAILAAACGGGTKAGPPPEPPAPVVSAKPITRVPIEDSELPDQNVTMVLNSKGHMEQAAVQDGIKPHEVELVGLLHDEGHRRRWLGGHVQIHWDIKADGVLYHGGEARRVRTSARGRSRSA